MARRMTFMTMMTVLEIHTASFQPRGFIIESMELSSNNRPAWKML